ncbi:hypothetical protein DMA11_10295 [Marinilabiliaceae bacterium JC017]|nr:hypothetical protein DMA11_10295 [Marinilabiliaceae bacterium JC017]
MDLRKKKQAMQALTDVKHLEADQSLLKAKKSNSVVLKRKYPTSERTQREVLWDLLEVASQEEIENNRKDGNAVDKEEEQEVVNAKEELKDLVLNKDTDYQQVKRLVKILGIDTENLKQKTLVFALKEFRGDIVENTTDNSEELDTAKAEDEEAQAETEEIKEDLSATETELEETQDELEEAKGDLEEKEQELETTQEELEETREQLEQTEAELEATKKKPETNDLPQQNTQQ